LELCRRVTGTAFGASQYATLKQTELDET
jgi:hypothetical protein